MGILCCFDVMLTHVTFSGLGSKSCGNVPRAKPTARSNLQPDDSNCDELVRTDNQHPRSHQITTHTLFSPPTQPSKWRTSAASLSTCKRSPEKYRPTSRDPEHPIQSPRSGQPTLESKKNREHARKNNILTYPFPSA